MRVPGVLAVLYLIPTRKRRVLSLPYFVILTPNSELPNSHRLPSYLLVLGRHASDGPIEGKEGRIRRKTPSSFKRSADLSAYLDPSPSPRRNPHWGRSTLTPFMKTSSEGSADAPSSSALSLTMCSAVRRYRPGARGRRSELFTSTSRFTFRWTILPSK